MNMMPVRNHKNATFVATGEFAFSSDDFRAIINLVKSESGIDLSESKGTLVYSRLAKRLRALGLTNFREYCDFIRIDNAERNNMLSALTTNVTKFFREPHHFKHLSTNAVSSIASAARRGERIRLWSAACSSGQEPYSIAISLLSAIPDALQLDIRILATDLNPHVVELGRAGIYRAEEMQDVPFEFRTRWFDSLSERGERRFRVADEVRSLVRFRELNLMNEWPMKGPFHAIFCRNVVIYFDQPTQARLWQRFAQFLPEGGLLYIGHSERLTGPAAALFGSEGVTTFKRRKSAHQ